MSPKKIIIIASVFFGVLAVGLGIYLAWQKSRELIAPPTLPISSTSSVSFPGGTEGFSISPEGQPSGQEIAVAKLRVLSDQAIFDYWTVYSTSTGQTDVFYLTEKGEIFKVIESGDDEMISSQALDNIQSVQSSRDGKWAAIKYGDLISPRIQLFNSEKELWQLMADNIGALAFSPDSQKIAYLEKVSGKQALSNLTTKTLTGAKPIITKIISLNQKNFDIKWLTADKILLVSKPSSQYEGEIWAVDIKKKTISFLANGNGLAVNFADDASWGLKFSVDSARTPHLQLIDKDGNSKANLDFSTLPEKCLPTLSLIYCAVPQSYSSNKKSNLPDDYLKKGVYSRDYIYRIDVNQNTEDIIYSQNEPAIDAFGFSRRDNRLFFINRYDDKLYQIEL